MADNYMGAADAGSTIIGIPDAILKVHTNDMLFDAMPRMRFDQFAVVRTDLTREPGDTIVFTKLGNLPRGKKLTEDENLVRKTLGRSKIQITVDEWGNAVGLTSKFQTLSFMDEMENASISLGRDYARETDIMLRDAVFSGTQTYLAGGKTAQKDLTVNDTLSLDDFDDVIEVLATANVGKYADSNGEYFVCYLHPHQAKPIRKQMIPVRQYTYPELIFKGEIGEYNGIRSIETSHCPNGAAPSTLDAYGQYVDPAHDPTLVAAYEYASGETNAVNLYKCVVFGERAYGWAVALPVELREDPFTDFGRKKGLAWYAIQGAGKINDENIVVVITA